jgi:hypothetical protein
MLRRIALLSLMIGVAVPAFAQNVHLKPPRSKPAFFDGGLYLTAQGQVAGLGNGDVLVVMVAQANVTTTCTNQGGNAAPGQNPAPITVSGSEAIPASELKNGTTPFQVRTEAPPSSIPGAPDCANTNWTESIDDLFFTSATITIDQPLGTTVLTIHCTFNPPTSNGSVPASTVTCSVQ